VKSIFIYTNVMSLIDGVVCLCSRVEYTDIMIECFIRFSGFFLTQVYSLVSWVFFSMCTIMGVVTFIEARKTYNELLTCTFNEGNSVTLTVSINKIKRTSVTFRKSVISQF
jgi:hypothetical protein